MAAYVGVSDHAGWAVFVTVAAGAVVDRRRVALVAEDLPSMPHHHDAQGLPPEDGVRLVEVVRASAEHHARAALEALATEHAIRGIALRACHELPPTIAERIANYRARNVADWVMYRVALAGAARALGWAVTWYDAKRVLAEAPHDLLRDAGKALGPPWQIDHKQAMAAALTAASRRTRSSRSSAAASPRTRRIRRGARTRSARRT
jgi:hypothetical protein